MAIHKPGVQDTTTNRNKRESRHGVIGSGLNDVTYRLGVSDGPDVATADNKNRNRFS